MIRTVERPDAIPRAKRGERIIYLLFTVDFAFALVYLVDFVIVEPLGSSKDLLDLGGEANLPAWYASTQLFIVAALVGLLAYCHFQPSRPGSWPLVGLALLFLALSADEAISIHERAGIASDALLPGGSREGTPFDRTGIWMFVIGIPGASVIFIIFWSVRFYLLSSPGVAYKYIVGMMILVTGAVGVEILSNFVDDDSIAYAMQVAIEELMEMIGVTFLLWGTTDLLRVYGVSLDFDRVQLVMASRPPP